MEVGRNDSGPGGRRLGLRGSRDPIQEVFELGAAELANKHIPGKPSADGTSIYYVSHPISIEVITSPLYGCRN